MKGDPTLLVEVVLSSYDGAAWLEAQIASILGQTHGNLRLSVRDDGSRDGTPEMLAAWAEREERLSFRQGSRNLGPAGSFFRLLDSVGSDAAFVAFADQDDVWEADKIARAAAALSALPEGVPGLYCARVVIVDEDLRRRGLSPLPGRGPSLANALVENIAIGCTSVLNHAALALLRAEWPQPPVKHDWWCYQVVSALGQVIYDARPALKYRQHGGNMTGAGYTPLDRFLGKVGRQLNGEQSALRRHQAGELLRLFGDRLPARDRALVGAFLESEHGIASRLRYAVSGSVHRQYWLDNLAYRLLYILRGV
ncbi:glycosyltransferase [Oceanibaculum sp.]|uniref:glycosyltransferase n=1 Tax=Oceanibaculum sp. TaxID=1903597 RepID=UPI00258E1EDB|nr:glycosyltransferase [Oceanibaculum sp.]MCH2395554.1 glycosyltransferase [Oceanibaculum sp.]